MKRTAFLRSAIGLLGTPYIWGGRSGNDHGVDCWGTVAVAASQSAGPKDWMTWWTDKAWAELETLSHPDELEPGDLVFYGGDPTNPKDVGHVAVWLNSLGMILEASGGNHTTTSLIEARRVNAKVRITDSYLNRKDLRGYRRLPAE